MVCSNKKKTKEEFAEEAKSVHGGLYDYQRNRMCVKILCTKIFLQRPYEHLRGHGCTYCLTNQPTKQFKTVHRKGKNCLQKQRMSVYLSSKKKIEIKCNRCESNFWVVAKDHFRYGCRKCNNSSSISKPETKWLDEQEIPNVFRQKRLKVCGRTYIVDAFVPETNTIYEFLAWEFRNA